MRKRSKYRPKGVRLDNLTWIQAGFKKLDAIGAGTTLKIRNHDAMNNIRLGVATRQDIDAVIDAFNVAEALAKRGMGADWATEIRAAQDALLELARRGVSRGFRFIVKAEELTAMNLGMEIHDAQLDVVSVRELETAMNDVMENLKHKRMRSVVGAVESV